jgi:putative Mn2+ efflux pump MntP
MVRLAALLLPLGLDTFAISAGLGIAGARGRRRLHVALLFAAFEGAMPLVGLALGAPLGRAIGAAADYLAIVVLLTFGAFTLLAKEAPEEQRIAGLLNARGLGLVALGLSVSMDELAIGFTLGLLHLPAVAAIIFIIVQAFVVAQLGLRLGAYLSDRVREDIERLAGVALVALGLVLLAEKPLG